MNFRQNIESKFVATKKSYVENILPLEKIVTPVDNVEKCSSTNTNILQMKKRKLVGTNYFWKLSSPILMLNSNAWKLS